MNTGTSNPRNANPPRIPSELIDAVFATHTEGGECTWDREKQPRSNAFPRVAHTTTESS